MPSIPASRALLQAHLCVLLWAFTAIFGRLISLPAAQLVAWRLLLVVGLLALLPRSWRMARALRPRELLRFAGIGALVALHWLAFYGSIKLANASVATICLAISPATIALLEPVLHGTALRRADLALGVAVIPGILLIAGGIPESMDAGLGVGLLAAVLGAAFMMLNARHVGERDAIGVTAIEFAAGLVTTLLLLPWLPGAPQGATSLAGLLVVPTLRDLMLLGLLATACTLLPFALSLVALRRISAFSMQLTVNLEPVYAIAIAAVFLGEARELGPAFYAGTALLIAAVLLHGWRSTRAPVTPPSGA